MFRIISAVVILICVLTFYLINLWNLIKSKKFYRKTESLKVQSNEEENLPKSFMLGVAAFFTLIFWFTVTIYPFLIFFEIFEKLGNILIRFSFPFDFILHYFGLGLILFGFLLFDWSVIARGRYATSWDMRKNHKLVTWGPYALVRHPAYLSYFLMFIGLFSLWPNLLTLLPILAIPGYVKLTDLEENMLIKKFRNEYKQYQRKVGRFLPKIRKPKTQINKLENNI